MPYINQKFKSFIISPKKSHYSEKHKLEREQCLLTSKNILPLRPASVERNFEQGFIARFILATIMLNECDIRRIINNFKKEMKDEPKQIIMLWTLDLNVRHKTSEENLWENLCDFGLDKDFLDSMKPLKKMLNYTLSKLKAFALG